jgi:hypothetical protein
MILSHKVGVLSHLTVRQVKCLIKNSITDNIKNLSHQLMRQVISTTYTTHKNLLVYSFLSIYIGSVRQVHIFSNINKLFEYNR